MLVHCPSCEHVNADTDPACKHCGTVSGSSAAAANNLGLPENEGVFFPVSLLKLSVMTLCTFGLYEYFWMFQCWNYVKRADSKKVLPWARAFFGVLYCYNLFAEIGAIGKTINPAKTLAVGPLAMTWILLTVVARIPHLPPACNLIPFLALIPMLFVQNYVLGLNKHLGKDQYSNSKFSILNWITIVIGGILFVFGVIHALSQFPFRPMTPGHCAP
jgi:hypothetical protein